MRALVIGLVVVFTGCGGRADRDGEPTRAKPHDDPTPHEEIDDARVQAIVTAYDTSMAQCPERVWVGHDWSDNHVVLLQRSTQRAWVWSADSTLEVDPATLPPEWSGFEFFTVDIYEGQVSLGIDLDATDDFNTPQDYADLAILLAFHEGFHFLGGQDDFRVNDTGGRDPVLPLDWHPRFVRAEEIDSLRTALTEQSDLGVASHWHARYAEFAEDRANLEGLDVIEDTAQYVETVSAIVAKLGCDASDDAINAEARAHADDFVVDPGYDAGGESYQLGPAAGLILRAQGGQFEEDAKERPMQDLLLDDVTAATVDEDAPAVATVSDDAEQAVTALNDSAAADAEPLFTAWDEPTTVRLAFPYQSLDGAFGYEQGFVFGARDDDAHVMFHLSASFSLSQGTATLDDENVMDDESACGTETFAVPLDPATATRDGDTVTVTVAAGGIEASGVHITEHTVAGRTWWCVD